MHDHIDNSKYNRILKVNVEDYDQQPDYNMLVIDYKFYIDIFDKIFYIRGWDYGQVLYNPLKKVLMKYDKGGGITIPLKDLKNNEELQTEFIFFTETFCINKNIPANRIEEVIEIT